MSYFDETNTRKKQLYSDDFKPKSTIPELIVKISNALDELSPHFEEIIIGCMGLIDILLQANDEISLDFDEDKTYIKNKDDADFYQENLMDIVLLIKKLGPIFHLSLLLPYNELIDLMETSIDQLKQLNNIIVIDDMDVIMQFHEHLLDCQDGCQAREFHQKRIKQRLSILRTEKIKGL